jgi:AcrR family transcriptional regulator
MARTAKADYRALMTQVARRRLESGEEVTVTSVAAELNVSPGLVHFYFGDRQSLLNSAWQEILMAHVDGDVAAVRSFAESADWNGLRELSDRVFAEDRDDLTSLICGPLWSPSKIVTYQRSLNQLPRSR